MHNSAVLSWTRPAMAYVCPVYRFTTAMENRFPSPLSPSLRTKELNQKKRMELNVSKSKPYRDIWREKILKPSNSNCMFQAQNTNSRTILDSVTSMSNKEMIAAVTELASQTLDRKKKDDRKWEKLFDALSSRINVLTKEEVFYVADCAYVSSHYPHRFLWQVAHCWTIKGVEAMKLTPDDIVRVLFYVAMTKDISAEFFAMCEDVIQKHLNEFSILELSMICTSYFSCNISFRSYATVTGLAKCITHQPPEALDLVTVTNFLKVFRHAKYSNTCFYEKLGDLLSVKSFDNLQSLSPLSNIVLAFTKIRVRHDRLFSLVLTAAEEYARSKTHREKDVLRILSASAMLQLPVPESFVHLVLQDLHQNTAAYPNNAVENAVLSLGMLGYFPDDLISTVLSSEKAQARKLSSHDDWETFQYINAMAQTLGDEYHGELLQSQHKVARDDLPPLFTNMERRDGFLPILQALQKLVGQDRVGCEFLLNASLIPDIMLHLNSENIPQKCQECTIEWPVTSAPKDQGTSIKDEFIEGGIPSTGVFETPSNFISLSPSKKGQERRISIKVFSFNQYTVNTPRVVMGRYMLEVVLLNKLGYDVMVVWPVDAHRIPMMSEAEVKGYIHTHILSPLGVNLESLGEKAKISA